MFYWLLIGAVALFGYLFGKHPWRLLDGGRRKPPAQNLADDTSSSVLNAAAKDGSSKPQDASNTPDVRQHSPSESDPHVEGDRRILQEYTWTSYKDQPLRMKQAMEPVVLRSLLLTLSEVSYDTCSSCLRDHDDVRALLLEGWERGTFEALRRNPTFLLLCNPIAHDKNNATSLPSQGLKEDASPEGFGTSGDIAITLASETYSEPLSVANMSRRNYVAKADVIGREPGRNEDEKQKEEECVRDGNVFVNEMFQGAQGINIRDSKFVSTSGGPVYNVAGSLRRITYLNDESRKTGEWYYFIDYRATHNEIAKKRSEKTGGWFLRSKTYGEWCTSPQRRLMWCPGIPGVGKTVMASLVVDHLHTFDESRTFVGSIYFNYNLRPHQSKVAILQALCRQMFEFRQQPIFKDLYDSHEKRKSRPTEAELRVALSIAIRGYQNCYLVLDALDEYTVQYSDKEVREVIRGILSLGENVKLLITSRVLGEMKATFKELGASREEIIADDDDMGAYLVERIDTLKSKLDFEVSGEFSKLIVDKVIQAAKGRFLVAELGMNLLAEQLNLGDLEDALENLPHEIDETYNRVMELIKNYSGPQRELAMKALMWVAYARRPLSVGELRHALATKNGRKETYKYVTPLSTITGLCAGLVVVKDKEWRHDSDDERIVQFVHFTTQEFFQQFQSKYFLDAHQGMFSTCIEYLSITGDHTLAAHLDRKEYRWVLDRRARLPFYNYAALNWGYHADTHHKPLPAVFEFLQSNGQPVLLNCNHILAEWGDRTTEKGGPSIFLAAYHDQTDALSILLDGTDSIPLTESQRTPLHLAAIAGRPKSTKQILQWSNSSHNEDGPTNTDIPAGSRIGDSRDSEGRTPISYAAECGQELVVKMLIEHGVNVDSKDNDGRTPLSYAASQGNESTFKLFLEHEGVDVDSKDNNGWTPFSYAASQGNESIFKLLLEHEGVDVDSKDNHGRTPFSYAASQGNESIFKLLLEHERVNVDSKDNYGRTPFSHAAQYCQHSVIKLLLERGGIQVTTQYKDGRTALSWASTGGGWWQDQSYVVCTIRLLLAQGVEVNLADKEGRTPLFYARRFVNSEHPGLSAWQYVVDLLEENGAVELPLSIEDVDEE